MIPGARELFNFRRILHTVGMEPNDEESEGSIPIHSVESDVAMPTKPEPSQAEAVAESSETSDRTPESSSEHLPDALSEASPFSPKSLRRHLNTFAERTISMVRRLEWGVCMTGPLARQLASPWPQRPAHPAAGSCGARALAPTFRPAAPAGPAARPGRGGQRGGRGAAVAGGQGHHPPPHVGRRRRRRPALACGWAERGRRTALQPHPKIFKQPQLTAGCRHAGRALQVCAAREAAIQRPPVGHPTGGAALRLCGGR